MRTLSTTLTLSLGLVFAAIALTQPANAGSRSWYLCWTGLNGATACANLPNRFHIPGVRRPTGRGETRSFQLTRSQIRALSRFVDTENMRPAYQATLYQPKRRARFARARVRGFTRRPQRTTRVRSARRTAQVRQVRQVRRVRQVRSARQVRRT
ncbi:MAG: hypothetical protein AAFQ11_08270, partial [Pseudomonadota bacterium]